MADNKGYNRGGVEGQEGELENRIAPEGSLDEKRPQQRGGSASVPQGGQPGNASAPRGEERSVPALDRETQTKHEVE